MFEYIRQRIEKNLVDEIECLNPTNLELVGHYLISNIEGQHLIHHGINKDYKPSGYTVDSFSSDSSIIVEYSTDKEYFLDEKNKKIRQDIEHALKHAENSQIKKIYLVCNHEEPASFRQKFNKTDVFLENKDKVIIFDSREMAKYIYQQCIENPNCTDFFRKFFPFFSQELDNYEYYGKIPAQCEKFCSEPTIIKSIEKHYSKGNHICVLCGLSGSGKTQASIDYVHLKKDEYKNYIWITGDDWKKDTSLCAVQRTRGGAPINVVGTFNKCKTILILDSIERNVYEEDFNELEQGFKMGGVVLATSQITGPENYYLKIQPFSECTAIDILGEENSQSELTKKIIEKCRFSPLILSTIRKMVELGHIEREVLYQEVLDSPEDILGEDGVSIIRKVLNKLDETTLNALRKIANTGLTVFDEEFLRKFIGSILYMGLRQLSIIMSTNTPGVVKIHDLICITMKDKKDCDEIAKKMEEYIDEKKGEMTPNVLRQIHLARKVIYKYKEQNQELDWLTYSLLQIEGEEKYKLTKEICFQNFEGTMPLSVVMCLVEAKELYGYTISNKEERKEYYQNCIEQYTKALKLFEEDDIKAELLHHLGKALRRAKDYKKAYISFEESLKFKPCSYATYGQIVTLGTMRVSNELKEAGKEYMRRLLKDMLEQSSKVPLRVSLATIARLRSYREIVDEMIDDEKKVEKISEIAQNAALEDIGQFFEAFVAISSIFSYHYSKQCILLAESVPEMIMVTPDIVEDYQWINACEAMTNLATAAQNEDKLELYKMLSDKSIEFADELLKKNTFNSFEARAIAKAYIKSNMPDKALSVINKALDGSQDHWLLYRKAEAEMLMGEEIAIDTAKRAYQLLVHDKRNANRIASYLELLSKCYERNRNFTQAVITIDAAIKKCIDHKYKKQLVQYKKKLQKCDEQFEGV